MDVDLTPEQQTFVQQAIESGRIRRPEEAVQEALNMWMERERAQQSRRFDKAKAQAAAASIRELRQGVTLGDLTVKDLVAEGRR